MCPTYAISITRGKFHTVLFISVSTDMKHLSLVVYLIFMLCLYSRYSRQHIVPVSVSRDIHEASLTQRLSRSSGYFRHNIPLLTLLCVARLYQVGSNIMYVTAIWQRNTDFFSLNKTWICRLVPNSRFYIPNIGLIFRVRLTHLWSNFFYKSAFPYRLY